MSSNNVAAFIVSRHQGDNGWDYRVQLQDGTMRLMAEQSVRCLVRGDLAIDEFNPDETFDGFPPPLTSMDGPREGDVIRVQIEGAWHVCTVLEFNADGPTYKVRYDDGMLIHDRLNVPWTYVATSNYEKSVKPQRMVLKIRKPSLEPMAEPMAAEPMAAEPMAAEPMAAGPGEPVAEQVDPMTIEPVVQSEVETAVESACEMPNESHASVPDPPAQLSEKQRGKLPMGATVPPSISVPPAVPDFPANDNMVKACSAAQNSWKYVAEYATLLDVL